MLYERVVEYCERNGMTISAFEKHCGLANGTVAKWKDNPGGARIDTILKIVERTGISIQKWVE